MKTTTSRLLALVLLAILPACSKKPVDVTGQIFVVTTNGAEEKIGGSRVFAIPDKEFRKFAIDLIPMLQDTTRNYPAEDSSKIVIGPIFEQIKKKLEASIEFPTSEADVDGRFETSINGKTWFLCLAEKPCDGFRIVYMFIKEVDYPKGSNKTTIAITNESKVNSVRDLYAIIAPLAGVSESYPKFVERVNSESKADPEITLSTQMQNGQYGHETTIPLIDETTLTIRWCPGGAFTMGSPVTEEGHQSDENQVSVTLSKGFWMAKTEVTQAQWQAVMANNPSSFKGDDLPVENVSWDDAKEFIKKVNGSGVMPSGWKMTLPTEAQWEYACRAGETGPYSGGAIDEVAWYRDNSGSKTHPVGTKKSNAWGLHDMHGNIAEWCEDLFDEELVGGTNPTGAPSGDYRSARGGFSNSITTGCRTAIRNAEPPDSSNSALGFRPAIVPSK
jgi:formylglycine-generating enzyme required for sulfatase activity